jgi:hypothetical protein
MPHFATRRSRFGLLAGLVAIGAVGVAAVALAGTIGAASGFEDDDGNLAVNSTFDWNGFSPVTWTGATPNQKATKGPDATTQGWKFAGLTDAQATSSDTGYAGGVKQDVDCATIKGSKAPNKDDLKRVYLSSKTVAGHVYLNLAWERIPQNSVNASTHVGFEFNQGTTACSGSSDGLVHRTAGDMLIVYDFAGSSAGVATLTMRRWVTSGACDISQDSPPCWGVAQDLTASGFAEAKVNEVSVPDSVAPGGDTLGVSEFGEAGVDLTAAGIFSSTQCTAFGQAEAVSRSSGNSGTAAMEDLVGPGSFRISNCGTLIVKKVTDPSPDPTNTSFSFTKNGSNNATTLPATFGLHNGESDSETVFAANDFSVAESVPANWTLTSASCDNNSGTLSGSTLSSITVAPDETVTCTFNDHLKRGALQILKNSTKGGPVHNAGAVFSYDGHSVTDNGSGDEDPAIGSVCVSGLVPGNYTVNETSAPAGYGHAVESNLTATVVDGTNCSTNPPSGTAVVTFTDPPLSDIQVNFRDNGSGETHATSITCDNTTGTSSNTPATGWDASNTVTGVNAPTTVHCTIQIDP